MHILFLSDNFPPEGNAPASRTYEHASQWVNSNNQVTVITCAPNFPDGILYKGYKNSWISKELINGINVWRVKTYITPNEGIIKRTLDFISFMLSSLFFGLFTKKIDIVIGTSPQFFTIISGFILAKIKKVPFVFELRDFWPESIRAVGAINNNIIIRLFEKIEFFLYRHSDHIICVTNSFKQILVSKGINEDKITVALNGIDNNLISKVPKPDLLENQKLNNLFTVGYIGTHGMAHSLETIVDVAEILSEHKDIVFLFIGGGSAKKSLDVYIDNKNLSNVISIGRQPKEYIDFYLKKCDISIAHLKNVHTFESVIPSKIFESMENQVPILLAIPEGEATKLIKESGCGISAIPENAKDISEKILYLKQNTLMLEDMRDASKIASLKFSRAKIADSILNTFHLLIESKTE